MSKWGFVKRVRVEGLCFLYWVCDDDGNMRILRLCFLVFCVILLDDVRLINWDDLRLIDLILKVIVFMVWICDIWVSGGFCKFVKRVWFWNWVL